MTKTVIISTPSNSSANPKLFIREIFHKYIYQLRISDIIAKFSKRFRTNLQHTDFLYVELYF